MTVDRNKTVVKTLLKKQKSKGQAVRTMSKEPLQPKSLNFPFSSNLPLKCM